MEAQPQEIRRYIRSDGSIPFAEWFLSLRDRRVRAKINERLRRVSLGNLGDYRSVGDGIFELRIDYGSGYRIYFARVKLTTILLLCGRDKSTQKQDIRKAKEYWRDYENRQSTH